MRTDQWPNNVWNGLRRLVATTREAEAGLLVSSCDEFNDDDDEAKSWRNQMADFLLSRMLSSCWRTLLVDTSTCSNQCSQFNLWGTNRRKGIGPFDTRCIHVEPANCYNTEAQIIAWPHDSYVSVSSRDRYPSILCLTETTLRVKFNSTCNPTRDLLVLVSFVVVQ